MRNGRIEKASSRRGKFWEALARMEMNRMESALVPEAVRRQWKHHNTIIPCDAQPSEYWSTSKW